MTLLSYIRIRCPLAPVRIECKFASHLGPSARPVFTATPAPLPSPQPAAADQGGLLSEIQALRELAQDLEKRVVQGASHPRDKNGGDFSPSASTPSPDPSWVAIGPTPSSCLGQVSEVVAHLSRVSMIQSSHLARSPRRRGTHLRRPGVQDRAHPGHPASTQIHGAAGQADAATARRGQGDSGQACHQRQLHPPRRAPPFTAGRTMCSMPGRTVRHLRWRQSWLLAARCGGPNEGVYQANPRRMMVKKPCNINDVDLFEKGLRLDLPISQPTDLSYFLQRIRLAETSRGIVDHNYMAVASSGGPGYDAHVMAIDAELD
ncbi:Rsm22-cox11 tandem protein 1, mitochondrial [Tolypocladium paradoxum]|uniref:Rsm22-cox11 tandem protein 1, mitochondrial n=1 Tax=Tolypocladium paradoxum TaxID=94208 RepID=A0A2S4KMU7_9HYPO|nr:Rsm22-cox11 tandem protein 1, mitochondrial [Tolypocladium paradoxum]